MASLGVRLFQFVRNYRPALLGVSVLAAVAVLLVGGSSNAEPPYWDSWGAPYSVALENENGSTLRSFRHAGDTFYLGTDGERYRVRISNHSGERVEAVLSVDGRDAISGRVGDYADQRGYIVPPHGSIVVDGFRQNLDSVARFRFTDPSSSYSSRMGTPQNVGVIGVAFFRERSHPPRRPYAYRREDPWDDWRSDRFSEEAPRRRAPSGSAPSPSSPRAADKSAPSTQSESAPSRKSSASAGEADPYGPYRHDAPWRREYRDDDYRPRGRLGTEYGESGWSPVSEVPFQRQNSTRPDSITTLRYDDEEGLRSRGIEVYRRPYWPSPVDPEPFPRSRYAPPPP
jgi:hypothetical protein